MSLPRSCNVRPHSLVANSAQPPPPAGKSSSAVVARHGHPTATTPSPSPSAAAVIASRSIPRSPPSNSAPLRQISSPIQNERRDFVASPTTVDAAVGAPRRLQPLQESTAAGISTVAQVNQRTSPQRLRKAQGISTETLSIAGILVVPRHGTPERRRTNKSPQSSPDKAPDGVSDDGVIVSDYAAASTVDLALVVKEQTFSFPILHQLIDRIGVEVVDAAQPLFRLVSLHEPQRDYRSLTVTQHIEPTRLRSDDANSTEVRLHVAFAEDSEVSASALQYELLSFDESFFARPPTMDNDGFVTLPFSGRFGTTMITFRVVDLAEFDLRADMVPHPVDVSLAPAFSASPSAILQIDIRNNKPRGVAALKSSKSIGPRTAMRQTGDVPPAHGTQQDDANAIDAAPSGSAQHGAQLNPSSLSSSTTQMTPAATLARGLIPMPISCFRSRPKMYHVRSLTDALLVDLPLTLLRRSTWAAEWRYMRRGSYRLRPCTSDEKHSAIQEANKLIESVASAVQLRIQVDSLLRSLDSSLKKLLSMPDADCVAMATEVAATRAQLMASALGITLQEPIDVTLALRIVSVRCDAVQALIRALVETGHLMKHTSDLVRAALCYRRAGELAHVVQRTGTSKIASLIPFAVACGDCDLLRGDARAALESYEKARAYAEASTEGSSNSAMLAECEDLLAVALTKLDQHSQANAALVRSMKYRSNGPRSLTRTQPETWLVQGWCCCAKKAFLQAENWFRKAADSLEHELALLLNPAAPSMQPLSDSHHHPVSSGAATTTTSLGAPHQVISPPLAGAISTLANSSTAAADADSLVASVTESLATTYAMWAICTSMLVSQAQQQQQLSDTAMDGNMAAAPTALSIQQGVKAEGVTNHARRAMELDRGDDEVITWIGTCLITGSESEMVKADKVENLLTSLHANGKREHPAAALFHASVVAFLALAVNAPGIDVRAVKTNMELHAATARFVAQRTLISHHFVNVLALEAHVRALLLCEKVEAAEEPCKALMAIINVYLTHERSVAHGGKSTGKVEAGEQPQDLSAATTPPSYTLLDLPVQFRISALLAHVVSRGRAVAQFYAGSKEDLAVTTDVVAPLTEWFLAVASRTHGAFSPSLVSLLLDAAEAHHCAHDYDVALELFAKALRITDSRNLLYLLGPLCLPGFRLTIGQVRDRARLCADRSPGQSGLVAIGLLLFQTALSLEAAGSLQASFDHLERAVALFECGDLQKHIGLVAIFASLSRVALKLSDLSNAHHYADCALETFASHHYQCGLYKGHKLSVDIFVCAQACKQAASEASRCMHTPLELHKPCSSAALAQLPAYM